MKAPAELAGVARSRLFWLEIAAAVGVGVCFTLGRTGTGWLLAGLWLLILIGDLATRDHTRDGGGPS